MLVKISQTVIEDLIAFAKNAYPNEMMVLLQGSMGKGEVNITSIIVQVLISNPQTAILTQGDGTTNIIGSCHSHPGRTTPSTADLVYFNKNPGVHLIIGYPYSRHTVACYNHLGDNIPLSII